LPVKDHPWQLKGHFGIPKVRLFANLGVGQDIFAIMSLSPLKSQINYSIV